MEGAKHLMEKEKAQPIHNSKELLAILDSGELQNDYDSLCKRTPFDGELL